jgi:signal transduction histidine kinase
MKEKVFEPFFRTKEAEAQKGSGIGLTVSKSLVELHNGTIELKQSENNLNVFALTLPTHQKTKLNSISKKRSHSL